MDDRVSLGKMYQSSPKSSLPTGYDTIQTYEHRLGMFSSSSTEIDSCCLRRLEHGKLARSRPGLGSELSQMRVERVSSVLIEVER